MGRILSFLQRVHQGHERLKDRIHNGFRYPLPRWGQYMMGFVYFSIPVLLSIPLYQWVQSKSKQNLGEHGEKLQAIQGIGDKRQLPDGTWERVGAGGWGGGTRLVVSDSQAQEEYNAKFKAYLKREREERKKRERAQAAKAAKNAAAAGGTAEAPQIVESGGKDLPKDS